MPAGGLEFVVETEQPPHLFVIRKQQRRGQDTSQANAAVTLLALYYILDKCAVAPRVRTAGQTAYVCARVCCGI